MIELATDDRRDPNEVLLSVAELLEQSKLDHDMVCALLHKVLASLSIMTQTREEYLQRSAHCYDLEMFLNPPQKGVH
jgi:hypothetical protein